jgi:hypothetical protein
MTDELARLAAQMNGLPELPRVVTRTVYSLPPGEWAKINLMIVGAFFAGCALVALLWFASRWMERFVDECLSGNSSEALDNAESVH